jgi:hypothetical protein
VKFSAEQHFSHPVEAVQQTLTDAEFLGSLGDVGFVRITEVLSTTVEGDEAETRSRFKLIAELPPLVTKFVDPDKITWVQIAQFEFAGGSEQIRIVPDSYGDMLRFDAGTNLIATPDGCVRRIAGDFGLRVRGLPSFMTNRVEQILVDGLKQYFTEEQARLDAWLNR